MSTTPWATSATASAPAQSRSLIGNLDRAAYYDEEASRINDFDMSEDINAAYLMNTVDIGDWRLIAGVRYEGTRFEAKGTGLRDGVYENDQQQQSL